MPLISTRTIDAIYDFPLTEAIGRIYTDASYKIRGNQAQGLSPFTAEKTPSFSVSNSKNIWKDFSTGSGGKSVVDFTMKYKNLSYYEALKYCAEALNIHIEYEEETPEQKQKREEKLSGLSLLEKTKTLFRKNLSASTEALRYMKERGFSDEILEDFEIGYACENQLYPIFKEKAVVTLAQEVGLLKQNSNGNYYQVFNYRIMFPICDIRGACVGFGGRVAPAGNYFPDEKKNASGGSPPKYLNSPESDIFNKGSLLYGFHLAKNAIIQTQEVYLVEGYTDVMRMHQIGLSQCVAPMGTALTSAQIVLLKKHCKKVIIFRDFDPAGQKAAFRDTQLLLSEGFFVEIIASSENGEKQDPDNIGQRENAVEYIKNLKKDALLFFIEEKHNFLLKEQGNDNTLSVENAKKFLDYILEILSLIKDNYTQEIYVETIAKQFKINKKHLLSGLEKQPKKEDKPLQIKPKNNSYDVLDMYDFPAEIENPQDFKDDILQYGLFQTNNQIYALVGKDQNYFKSVSNFSIEIIQHMQDEKFPMKLIRICNIFGREIIFDTLSQNINSVQSFFNLVTGFGNYNYSGNQAVHQKLLTYLFNKMGHGRKIEILGWQTEGFWVWNNEVIVPNEFSEKINSEGIFKFKNECFYIPSANKIYENNTGRYISQKKFQSFETDISLEKYLFQMVKVHRKHAYSGILFAISSLFQDVVVSHLGFFPLLFLYGKGSSGKDNLGEAIQSFVGKPQSAINLESGLSTGKASIREFAQFANGISQLSEYKRGDKQTDGTLKSLWDRRGYKMGTIESKISTDEVPILSSVVITGNEFPESQPLLMRVVFEEMNKNEFTNQEIKEFDYLKSIVKQGISSLTNGLLKFRKNVEEDFSEEYKKIKTLLNTSEDFKGTAGRIVENLSVLTTFYKLFSSYGVDFPFSLMELLEHWKRVVENINNKLSSASPISKFWDCFLFCMREKSGQENISLDFNYREEGGKLSFNFTTIFGIVQRRWYSQYHEASPSKSEMRKMLKDDTAFLEDGKSMRINANTNSPTCVMVIDLNQLSIREEILNEIEYQRMLKNPFPTKKMDDVEYIEKVILKNSDSENNVPF